MVTIKNQAQIEKMRIAGSILANGLTMLKQMVKPGVNCLDLDLAFATYIKQNHCQSNFKGYGGFPATICVSINDQLIHSIPTKRIIATGDIVSIDAGCIYEGMHADSALTLICGEAKNQIDVKLVEATSQALTLAIEQVRAGVRIGTISSTVQKYIEECGFQLPRDYSGHGIGAQMHEDPAIPNYGIANTGLRLQSGMVICIEPMVQISTAKTVVADDGWTVSSADHSNAAHFEHTILVKEDGYEVLTARKE